MLQTPASPRVARTRASSVAKSAMSRACAMPRSRFSPLLFKASLRQQRGAPAASRREPGPPARNRCRRDQARPRKDKDGDHGDVVQQHGGDQSLRSTAGRVLRAIQHATPRATSATPATRLTVTPGGVLSDEPSSKSTTTEGIASSANPVAVSSAPVTERNDLRLGAMLHAFRRLRSCNSGSGNRCRASA